MTNRIMWRCSCHRVVSRFLGVGAGEWGQHSKSRWRMSSITYHVSFQWQCSLGESRSAPVHIHGQQQMLKPVFYIAPSFQEAHLVCKWEWPYMGGFILARRDSSPVSYRYSLVNHKKRRVFWWQIARSRSLLRLWNNTLN